MIKILIGMGILLFIIFIIIISIHFLGWLWNKFFKSITDDNFEDGVLIILMLFAIIVFYILGDITNKTFNIL